MPKTGHAEVTFGLFPSFVNNLRRALRDLYDRGELRNNPLIHFLPVDLREGPSFLQKILISAIEDMKPSSSLSLQSDAWRIYNTLTSRYIQQFQQAEIANSLGVSIRQMRRMDNQAIQTLADHLWTKYRLESQLSSAGRLELPAASETPSREDELEWIKNSSVIEEVDIPGLIMVLVKTIEPLATSQNVIFQSQVSSEISKAYLRLEPLRLAWINLLIATILRIEKGILTLSAERQAQSIVMKAVYTCAATSKKFPDVDNQEDIQISRRLVEFVGGELEIQSEGCQGTISVTVPTNHATKVLAIDDNTDTLQLIERYLQGSHYVYVGTSHPHQALAFAIQHKPDVILLDLALPEIDGWELLSQFREHPDLKDTRIIVCSVLPQETLSLTLGAASFLRKPINQAVLLETLDRLSNPAAQRPD